MQFEQDVRLEIINSTPTGRVYRRFGKLHVASAPGQPPARDTGRLINSIYSVQRGVGFYRTGVGAIYAAILDDSNGRNRPFFASVFKRNRQRYQEIIAEEILKP